MKALSFLNKLISNISAILLGLMTLLVILQVFYRYVLNSPLTYSEELARFAMIWTVMLGSTVAFRNKSHILVEYFVEKLPAVLQSPVHVFRRLMVLIFCIVLVVKGFELANQAMSQLATASKIPVGWIVISLPISGAVTALYILEDALKKLFKNKDKTNQAENSLRQEV